MACIYELTGNTNPIGQGTYGIVYRVRKTSTGVKYALKTSPYSVCDPKFGIASPEYDILFRVDSPYVMSAVSLILPEQVAACPPVLRDAGYGVIIPLGESDLNGYDPGDTALISAQQIADGVLALYKAGYTHFDIKPGNIIVVGGVCKINDFGLSLSIYSRSVGSTRGTLDFRPPELQIEQGDPPLVGRRAYEKGDVFSIGSTLYEFLRLYGYGPRDPRPPYQGGERQFIQDNILFMEDNIQRMIDNIDTPTIRADMRVPDTTPRAVLLDVLSLVKRMINADPGVRPSLPDVSTQLRRVVSLVHPNYRIPSSIVSLRSFDIPPNPETLAYFANVPVRYRMVVNHIAYLMNFLATPYWSDDTMFPKISNDGTPGNALVPYIYVCRDIACPFYYLSRDTIPFGNDSSMYAPFVPPQTSIVQGDFAVARCEAFKAVIKFWNGQLNTTGLALEYAAAGQGSLMQGVRQVAGAAASTFYPYYLQEGTRLVQQGARLGVQGVQQAARLGVQGIQGLKEGVASAVESASEVAVGRVKGAYENYQRQRVVREAEAYRTLMEQEEREKEERRTERLALEAERLALEAKQREQRKHEEEYERIFGGNTSVAAALRGVDTMYRTVPKPLPPSRPLITQAQREARAAREAEQRAARAAREAENERLEYLSRINQGRRSPRRTIEEMQAILRETSKRR